jgi:hypothetical protein
MSEKLSVRLFYAAGCSGGCCSCGPNQDVAVFEGLAGRLAEKFGEDNLEFEAYNSIDYKKFPFLQKGKAKAPAVSVGEKVLSSGKLPLFSDLEKEIGKQLKVE